MKLGQECLISTLPSHIFPVDIALGVQEIKKGNNLTTIDDEVQTYEILLGTGPLTKDEEQNLHPDIKSRCLNSTIKKFVEITATKEQTDNLRRGNIVVISSESPRSGCTLQVRNAHLLCNIIYFIFKTQATEIVSSCWRWPNPYNGNNLWVHSIVTSVVNLTCCIESFFIPNCCEFGVLQIVIGL